MPPSPVALGASGDAGSSCAQGSRAKTAAQMLRGCAKHANASRSHSSAAQQRSSAAAQQRSSAAAQQAQGGKQRSSGTRQQWTRQ